MKIVKIINQVTAFVLEICMVVALGFIGYQQGKSILLKYTLAVGLPLIAMVLWGYFAAPKSDYRLALLWRMIFKITLFSITSWLLYMSGYPIMALSFLIIVLLNELTAYFFEA